MTSAEITERIYDNLTRSEETEITEGGFTYTVSVLLNSNICSLTISTPLEETGNAMKYAEILSATENLAFHYSYRNGKLSCSVCVWMGTKTGASSLEELIATVTANFRSVLTFMREEYVR